MNTCENIITPPKLITRVLPFKREQTHLHIFSPALSALKLERAICPRQPQPLYRSAISGSFPVLIVRMRVPPSGEISSAQRVWASKAELHYLRSCTGTARSPSPSSSAFFQHHGIMFPSLVDMKSTFHGDRPPLFIKGGVSHQSALLDHQCSARIAFRRHGKPGATGWEDAVQEGVFMAATIFVHKSASESKRHIFHGYSSRLLLSGEAAALEAKSRNEILVNISSLSHLFLVLPLPRGT